MAQRRCTLLRGKTMKRYVHKHRRHGPPPGTVIIIDKFSEVQLHLWAEQARGQLVG